jgi:hypothetical protein
MSANKKSRSRMKATKATLKKAALKLENSTHDAAIVFTDGNGDVWADSTTIALELGVSPFTWSGVMLPECEKFYGGDRNVFRRVRGRRAIWNWNLVRAWMLQRRSPKAGFAPRYIQKLRARGELAA